MKNNYRIKFSKYERMIFIGHLDLLKLFQKTSRKADIPIAYSNGFNPHQIMSFANPLPLGYSSKAEYLDIELTQEMNPEQLKDTLNANLPNGIHIIDVKKQDKTASSLLEAASYEAVFKQNISPEIINDILDKEDIFVDKKTKSGIKREDIRKDIFDLKLISSNTVYMMISTGSKQNLKPETVAELIYNYLKLDYNKLDVRYLRTEMYTKIDDKFINLGI